jgi:hypothetical protein
VDHIPGAREIRDPQAEMERLAALRDGVPTTETAGETAEITCDPVAVAKLADDAVRFSTAGYVLLRMGSVLQMGRSPGIVLTFEVHDDGIVIPPDGWEVISDEGTITGARHTGQPAPNGHLRRWKPSRDRPA